MDSRPADSQCEPDEDQGCYRFTSNPYFNFLNCYRYKNRHRRNQISSQQMVSEGAEAWRNLPESEREWYRKKAEPFLKKSRSRARETQSPQQMVRDDARECEIQPKSGMAQPGRMPSQERTSRPARQPDSMGQCPVYCPPSK